MSDINSRQSAEVIESRHNASQVVIRKLWERWHILYPLASSLPAGSRIWLHPIAWCKMKAPGISVYKLDTVPVKLSLLPVVLSIQECAWLWSRGPSPTAEEAVNCQWSLELELLLVEILYTWVTMVLHTSYHQSSYSGITAEENILCFGGMAGVEQSTWCQENISEEVSCLCCHPQSTCNCQRYKNQATPLAAKSIWSFSWAHTH